MIFFKRSEQVGSLATLEFNKISRPFAGDVQ